METLHKAFSRNEVKIKQYKYGAHCCVQLK